MLQKYANRSKVVGSTLTHSLIEQTLWLDPLVFDVAVMVGNSGRFMWNSPRTFAAVHDAANDYYFRLEGGGAKAESGYFRIAVPKGRVFFNWVANIVAGSKTYQIADELASVEAGTVMTLNYTVVDVDSSVTFVARLGRCANCDCVRSDSDASLPNCGGVFSFGSRDSACVDTNIEPIIASSPAVSGVRNYTISDVLTVDQCYFFYFDASRDEYSAASYSFKYTERAIALALPNVADWHAGETRDVAWTVLEDVSPTASLRFTLYAQSKYGLFSGDEKLSASDLFKVRDTKAPFTVPSSIDLKDNVFLELSIESGEYAGTKVRSATFKILPPAVATPTILLSGLSQSPRMWPTRSLQRVFFSTIAFDDPIKFPQVALATVTLEDENPTGIEPYKLLITDQLKLTPYGSFDVIVPVDAAASSSMRLVFFETRQNLTARSANFVVGGTNKCTPGAGGATASCANLAGRRFMYTADTYRVGIEKIDVAGRAECGGALVLTFDVAMRVDNAAQPVKLTSSSLTQGESQRLQVIVLSDLIVELIVSQVLYDAATGALSVRLRIENRKVQVTVDVVEQLRLQLDLSGLACMMGNDTAMLMPAPTAPPLASSSRTCKVDDARCSIMCTPAVMRKCECNDRDQLAAFCTTRQSVDLAAKCYRSDETDTRCNEVCGKRSVPSFCSCMVDGGAAVSCGPESCPPMAELEAQCAKACSTYGVQQCTCNAGQMSVYCNGQAVPIVASTTAPTSTMTADAVRVSSPMTLMSMLLTIATVLLIL
jgi:hypothetical protein